MVQRIDVDLPDQEYPALLVTGDIVHLVDGDVLFTHIMFNKKTWDLQHYYYDKDDLSGYQGTFCTQKMVFSKATNHIYLFGYGDPDESDDCDGNVLFKYSLEKKKWTVLSPTNLNSIGMIFIGASIVCSADGKYIFILRGETGDVEGSFSQSVAVLDVEQDILKCSSIVLPAAYRDGVYDASTIWQSHSGKFSGIYDAAILRDQLQESMLAFGYIRDICRVPNCGGMSYIPSDIMQLISEWVCVEYIHVVRINSHCGQHFRVNVDAIMRSVK